MKEATVRLVFDRKKVADKMRLGLVQIEVLYDGRRRWFSSGVRVYADQWRDGLGVVNSPEQYELNDMLRDKMERIEAWIRGHVPFSWEAFGRFLERGGVDERDFADYVAATIDGRNDLRDSTKRAHRRVVSLLRDFGEIRSFGDLTPKNIMAFDNYLHGRTVRRIDADGTVREGRMRQQSVFGVHKILKVYVRMAVIAGDLRENPYERLRFKRGASEPNRFLTEEELAQLEGARYREGSVTRARDLFVFQCYTGLSYSDLAEFDAEKLLDVGGSDVYMGKRRKTGEMFTFVLLPKARAVLEKYGGRLPLVALAVYNRVLKRAAWEAGIDRPVASHWARRTAAVLFATHGVPFEVIAKILGHSSVQTTERFYAELNVKSVVEAMRKVNL